MAHFYGRIQGARGEATRLGNSRSGLSVSAQSYEGSVTVDLESRMRDGRDEDWVTIRARSDSGQGGREVYQGPVAVLAVRGTVQGADPCRTFECCQYAGVCQTCGYCKDHGGEDCGGLTGRMREAVKSAEVAETIGRLLHGLSEEERAAVVALLVADKGRR